MTVTGQLDAIDWKILKELQANGRLSNVELAARVGLSPPPCLRRVKALEEGGYIAGYRALLDAARLGFDVQLFAHVGLKSQAESELNAFIARVRNWPLVRECYAVSGGADFILRCAGRDIHTLQDFIIRELTAAPNVDSVKTSLILDISKYEPGVPIR
jgi:DNA-binding Lrp family transcriptional regulator